MIAAFVDESERDEDFYFLGALVCDQSQHDKIRSSLNGILERLADEISGFPVDAEFHGYDIIQGVGSWKGLGVRRAIGIYRQALRAVAASGACMHIEGVDVRAQVARGYPHPTPPRELAFSHLFERINECAERQGSRVQVYADEHHTKEVSRSNFRSYRAFGTYGYKSSKLKNIEPEIEFIDSRVSRSMQAADMITYLYNRLRTVPHVDPREESARRQMWAEILPAVARGGARIWP